MRRRPNPSRGARPRHGSGGRTRSRCIGRIQVVVATRSLLAYRAISEADPVLPHCDSCQLKRGSASMWTEPLEAIQERHRGATRSEQQRILPRVFFHIAGYHRKRAIGGAVFNGAGGPSWTSIAPCSISSRTSRRCAPVPHSGILDKTCARRSARGRSAPRNGPLDPTKECDLDLGPGQATSEADNTPS